MSRLPFVGAILIAIALAYGTAIGGVLGLLGAICLLGSVYSRRDGLILFGPFAVWDLVRTARKKQLFLFRTLLASVVLIYLLFNLTRIFGRNGAGTLVKNQLSLRAEEVFIFVGIAISGFSLLYSLITFPSILAEERETKRLDHLLVTDLRNSEIILGKIAGRVAVLFGYILTLLPILAMLSLLGGVDLNLLLVGSLILVLTLFGLTGICIACSARASSTGSATRLTIMVVVALMVCPMSAKVLLGSVFSASLLPSRIVNCLDFLTYLSPFRVTSEIEANTSGNYLDDNILSALRLFAANQWILLVLGWSIGSWLLRKPASRGNAEAVSEVSESVPQSEGPTAVSHAGSYRPPVTDQPVLWKEMHTSNSALGRYLTRTVKARYWLAPVLTLLAIGIFSTSNKFKNSFTGFLQASGHISFWMLAFPVGIMASRLIARERQLDTLNALLLTSLDIEEILRQKWWAAVLTVRANYLIWLTVWTTGVLLGHMQPLAYILVNLIALANIALAATVGLWSSIHSKTSSAATAKLVGFSFLYMFGIICFFSCMMTGGGGRVFVVLLGALVPIAPQSAATFLGSNTTSADYLYIFFVSGLGLLASSFLANVLRDMVEREFREQVRPRPTPQPPDEKAMSKE